MHDVLQEIRSAPARQQPDWADRDQVDRVVRELETRRPLVGAHDVRTLRSLLAHVAQGRALIVQAGDCAEDPAECGAVDVSRKRALLDLLAGTVRMAAHKPVLRVGRIAGQYCKPRSNPVEQVGGRRLTPYRGHMVNLPEPTEERRRPDPRRILDCYASADLIVNRLGWWGRREPLLEAGVWTSHEALLLDYEIPMLRHTSAGGLLLTSTHFPWIGERTRQLDGAHVAMLRRVVNPVACKVGPQMTPDEAVALCEQLDPRREPGRLTLISRMGADLVTRRLPALVRAVRAAGHPVIWLCDPMHGNTITTPDGLKTRLLDTVIAEVRGFQWAVNTSGGVAGGLHLETTPDAVTECVPCESWTDRVAHKYTTLCDPRLNPQQAVQVAAAWQG
ncbi:3-deoxy-7-phosphoheptulonate synthase [Actinocrinis sp.]|uniref:3-deoxy-7-phosphoheptulonate synthase n=1 Tax=Actinocrinis sp. TaxID=1920516 RepID=UPI002D5E328F|nr:3-deoxy-7-phosphoheptulonate synthase [Actinocrinis sp.]HZP51752.1 3-deoxy-7-phosphoheptulonate synthase [Actinocrinis sp.]